MISSRNVGLRWDTVKDVMLTDADENNSVEGINTLRDIYLNPNEVENTCREGIRIANDMEAMNWIYDFWSYYCWVFDMDAVHLSDIGFEGFVGAIVDPDTVTHILLPEGVSISNCPPDAVDLYDRLIRLNRRFTVFQKLNKRRR